MEGEAAGVDGAPRAAIGGVTGVQAELSGSALGPVADPPHIPRAVPGPVERLTVATDLPLDRVCEECFGAVAVAERCRIRVAVVGTAHGDHIR
jgi:hypothetical protein